MRALSPLDAMAVENPVHPGTPDVNFSVGWIELKWLRRWPSRDTTKVRVESFTKQQRIWLRRRYRLSYNAWFMLQVQREWLLLTGRDAADYVDGLTRRGLYRVCRARWTEGLNEEELRRCLTMDWESWNGLPVVNGCF